MTRIEKNWGYELIFVNNELYCGKILHFYTNKYCSLHYHLEKTETWYVHSGKFEGVFINTLDGSRHIENLKAGDIINNIPGRPHKLICLEEGEIFEVSTQHFDCDSYRIESSCTYEN